MGKTKKIVKSNKKNNLKISEPKVAEIELSYFGKSIGKIELTQEELDFINMGVIFGYR